MRNQVSTVALILAAAFGTIVLNQCTEVIEKEQTAQKEVEPDRLKQGEVFDVKDQKNQDDHMDEQVTSKVVRQKFKEAFETTAEHVDQQLDELAQNQAIKRMERTAEQLDKKIIELEARLDERDLSNKAKKEMKDLKAVQKDLDNQLKVVQEASADRWNELKKDTKVVYKRSESTIEQEVQKIEGLLADSRK